MPFLKLSCFSKVFFSYSPSAPKTLNKSQGSRGTYLVPGRVFWMLCNFFLHSQMQKVRCWEIKLAQCSQLAWSSTGLPMGESTLPLTFWTKALMTWVVHTSWKSLVCVPCFQVLAPQPDSMSASLAVIYFISTCLEYMRFRFILGPCT